MRWILTTLALTGMVGCNIGTVQEAKVESHKRWNHSRAQVLCGVAAEHLRVGQLDQARLKVTEALGLEQDCVPARLLLAKVLIEQGQYAQASEELTKLRLQVPDSPDVVYLLGVAQEKDGKLEEALALYRRVHAMDASNMESVMACGEVLVALGQVREAQHQVESYLGLAETDPGMHELAGRLAMMNHEYDKAARYYQHASDLDSKNFRYRESLGCARFRAGQYAEAVEALTALTEVKDRKTPAWVYTMIGDSYMAMGRWHNARIAYDAAADRAADSAEAWINVAKAALSAGEESRSVQAARRALQLETGSIDAVLLLGYALLRDRQVTRAISELTQAVAAHPGSGTLRCLLGKAYAAAGNVGEAVRWYADALKVEPGSALARELLAAAGGKETTRTR